MSEKKDPEGRGIMGPEERRARAEEFAATEDVRVARVTLMEHILLLVDGQKTSEKERSDLREHFATHEIRLSTLEANIPCEGLVALRESFAVHSGVEDVRDEIDERVSKKLSAWRAIQWGTIALAGLVLLRKFLEVVSELDLRSVLARVLEVVR